MELLLIIKIMFHQHDLHPIHIQIVDQLTVVVVTELHLQQPVHVHLIDQMLKVFQLQLVMIVVAVIKKTIYLLVNMKMKLYYVKNQNIAE